MDPVRQFCVWLGVGAGHAVLLVAAWGSGAAPTQSGGDGLVTVWLLSEPAAEAPVVAATSQVPVSPARSSTSQPVRPVFSAIPSSSAVANPVMATGEAAEAVGTPPVFVDRVEPVYPRGARLAGIQGVVRLGLEISATGALRRVSVLTSSGDASLDRAALDAAQASSYGPARASGRSVDAAVEASYRFELR